MRAIVVMFVLANAGCLRKTEFQCSDDTSCGAAGRCESTGFCSFVDGNCASGRRYDDSAGSLAGTCAGGGDAGPDGGGGNDDASPPSDGNNPDTPNGNCPAGYGPLTGVPGHLYKVVPTTASWDAQRDACKATSPSAYLAIPDTLEELTAMDAIAGATTYWVGISRASNGAPWENVLNMPQTFLPWEGGTPSGGQGTNCVEAISALHKINNIRCNQSRPALCECNP